MSLLEIAKKLFEIIIDFFKYLDKKNSVDSNQNISNQVSTNRQDDTYIKSLLHENEIRHLKKEIDNLNRSRDYNDDEIRLLRRQVDILSKRCEDLLIKQYEHIIDDQNKSISQRTPQNDNMNEPQSNDKR